MILRQDRAPSQQALSDFTETGDLGHRIAGEPLTHRLYHLALAYSARKEGEVALEGRVYGAGLWYPEHAAGAGRCPGQTPLGQHLSGVPQSRLRRR